MFQARILEMEDFVTWKSQGRVAIFNLQLLCTSALLPAQKAAAVLYLQLQPTQVCRFQEKLILRRIKHSLVPGGLKCFDIWTNSVSFIYRWRLWVLFLAPGQREQEENKWP